MHGVLVVRDELLKQHPWLVKSLYRAFTEAKQRYLARLDEHLRRMGLRGKLYVMLSGGAHSMIHPFGVTGFNLLTALSTRNDAPEKASRPFDMARDGFVMGEGAGILILEDLEHAEKRGAGSHRAADRGRVPLDEGHPVRL